MRRVDYRPHHVEPQATRDQLLEAAKVAYPSTGFDDGDWLQVLIEDDQMFADILGDIAHITRLRRDRGRLHLDRSGREIPEGER